MGTRNGDSCHLKKWGQAPLNHKSLFLGLPIGFKVDSKPYLLLVKDCQVGSPKGDCLLIEFLIESRFVLLDFSFI